MQKIVVKSHESLFMLDEYGPIPRKEMDGNYYKVTFTIAKW